VQPWFELYPEVLDREIQAFADANIGAELDRDALALGVVRFRLRYPTKDGEVALEATYPDFFPFFRPEVSAADLNLNRHQHPMGGNLCLLGRRTSNWFAGETLASVLKSQLPHLLAYNETADLGALQAVEEAQGEPASAYYNGIAVPESYLLIDSSWKFDAGVVEGKFFAQCRVIKRQDRPHLTVQGFVDRVLGNDNSVLASWSGPRPAHFDTPFSGTWLRIDEPVLGGIDEFKKKVGAAGWSKILKDPSGKPNAHLMLGAVVYPEEVLHNQVADGLVFFGFDVPRATKGGLRTVQATFVSTARAGADDLAARVPATAALRDKRIAIFGVGAVGSAIAVELARTGARELRLIDADTMEPSTARRWEVGWTAFNRQKVMALKDRLNADYPWTEVTSIPVKIGAVSEAELGMERQGEALERMLTDIDLVIDATAEMGVNHFLSETCRVRDIPYMLASATPGAWGGTVAWFSRDTPCWMCMRHGMYESGDIPLPPADMGAGGEIQPPGCAEPTFSGAAFDLREVSLQAVRSASELMSGKLTVDAVPQLQILRLRSDEGERVSPVWTTEPIPRRDGCWCSQ